MWKGDLTRKGVAGAAAMMALAVAGCASVPEGRQILLPDLPKNAEASSPSVREHQRVLSAYGGAYEDPRLHAKLTSIVNHLVAASDRPDLSYKITILNSPAVNAFALPNGQLYVTRGLLSLANDSAEFASVMSHEMAHVIARHAATREVQARKTELISNVNDLLGDPQVGAMALARAKIALASFSRIQELEADSIGVGIAARAGFDPFGASRLLASMGRKAELYAASHGAGGRSLDFMSSHPATPERVKNAEDSARQLPATGRTHRDKAAYLTSIDGMTYGEDPADGFVRGRIFLHPRLGFSVMAPEGFVLDNTAQAVLGTKEGGQALRIDVVKVSPQQSLIEYLNSGWIEKIENGSVEELTVNGLQAATATAVGNDWMFRLYVVRFNGDVYRFIFAARNRTVEADRAFRESIQSFRRLSPQEMRSIKPLHLKIVKVQPGDTVESLSTRMVPFDHQVERFQVLNGLEPDEQLKTGDFVKIIVE